MSGTVTPLRPPAKPCGFTRRATVGEWVCVAPVHDVEKTEGLHWPGVIPSAERHHFVHRDLRADD